MKHAVGACGIGLCPRSRLGLVPLCRAYSGRRSFAHGKSLASDEDHDVVRRNDADLRTIRGK